MLTVELWGGGGHTDYLLDLANPGCPREGVAHFHNHGHNVCGGGVGRSGEAWRKARIRARRRANTGGPDIHKGAPVEHAGLRWRSDDGNQLFDVGLGNSGGGLTGLVGPVELVMSP